MAVTVGTQTALAARKQLRKSIQDEAVPAGGCLHQFYDEVLPLFSPIHISFDVDCVSAAAAGPC